MKKIFYLLVACSSLNIAQNFFPLSVDDKYQYKMYWYVSGPGGYYESGTDYYSVTVTQDSVIYDSIYYKIPALWSNSPYNNDYFFRYNESIQKVFMKITDDDTVRLGFDYSIPADSSLVSYIRGEPYEFVSNGISTQSIFNNLRPVYSMTHLDYGLRFDYQFADSLGLILFEYAAGDIFFNSYSEHELISAIIDSLQYNPIALQIDSMYPVIDRPINTFPFLLTIPFTTNYQALIDSFSLSIEVLRSDSAFASSIIEIPLSNPKVSINPTGLEVGDKIKLRAFIRDHSIYNNSHFYPDTGWAALTVLPPVSSVEDIINNLKFKLEQNFPNPFNPSTTIGFHLSEGSDVTLKVYDVLGRKVATIVDEYIVAGYHEVEFNLANPIGAGSIKKPASGIYYYKLKAGDFVETKKMILLK
ncbi:MAG TPA: T9SS type A sorting domain-containing protein [Ignavibacteriaceae bacterium]|nr:T9SS type A sorting domain-containing protein [Ignavibacteriaceae bacterium]